MKMMVGLVGLLAVTACTGDDTDHDEVVPHAPVTGPVVRYVVDRIDLPNTDEEARALAADLDGDRALDNRAGGALATVTSWSELGNQHRDHVIASGVVASAIEIQADDLRNDDSVFVWYRGADGALAEPIFGSLRDGIFASEAEALRSRPGAATLVLPAFADADPVVVEAELLQLVLKPVATGYDVRVLVALDAEAGRLAAAESLAQAVAARPSAHPVFVRIVDDMRTLDLSGRGIANSSFVQSLLRPDLDRYTDDGELAPRGDTDPARAESISLGFAVHVALCASGRCAEPAAPTCFDRVQNGAETARDCGGTCEPCAGGSTCLVAEDCQDGACDASTCRAPSCTDGTTNGFESDVDCGYACGVCNRGETCVTSVDCAVRCDQTCI